MSTSNRRAAIAGNPAASAPAAPAKVPVRLYQAKRPVRSRGSDVSASTVCSVGRNSVTSPADGFTVPTKAMARSGQNAVTPKNPRAVAQKADRQRQHRRAEQRGRDDRADLQRAEAEPAEIAGEQHAHHAVREAARSAGEQERPRVARRTRGQDSGIP